MIDTEGEYEYTEEGIILEYWEYWAGRMIEHGGLSPLITEQNCIYDWCVVNWAVEIK